MLEITPEQREVIADAARLTDELLSASEHVTKPGLATAVFTVILQCHAEQKMQRELKAQQEQYANQNQGRVQAPMGLGIPRI